MPLPAFFATGNLKEMLVATGSTIPTQGWRSARLRFSHNITKGVIVWDGAIHSRPPAVDVAVNSDGTIGNIALLANDPDLPVTGIQWRVEIIVRGSLITEMRFDAPAAGVTVNLKDVVQVPGIAAQWITRGDKGDSLDDVELDGTELVAYVKGNEVGRLDLEPILPGAAWGNLAGKPTEIAAGATKAAARASIEAASTSDVTAAVIAEDIPGKVSAAVAADDTVIDAAAAAVSADIEGRDLVEANDILIDDYAFAIADHADRLALAVYADGAVRIFKLDTASITDGSLTYAKLSAAVQSQLVAAGIGPMLSTVTDDGGYAWSVVDNAGRIALGVKSDGTVVGKLQQPTPTPPLLAEISGTTPTRKLWALNHTTGARTLVTDENDPRDAVEDNGAILFTDNTGRRVYVDGRIVPAYPDRSVIACWGDSLTQGVGTPGFTDPSLAWPGQLDALIAATTVNLGVGGETADEIVLRQGGYVLQLAVAGGSIPASGSVVVTTTQKFGHKYTSGWLQAGTLAGVAGTLARTGSDPVGQYTFTRSGSGSAVAVAGTAPFISADGVTNESHPAILFLGRNDITVAMPDGIDIPDTVTRVVAAYDAAAARLRAYHKEFLVLGTTTATTELAGTPRYMVVTTLNNALAVRYGNRFVDIRHYLVTQCIYDLGITPTTADLAAMAGDTLPPSIMADGGTDPVHFSPAAAAKIAAVLKTELDARGWTL